MLPILHSKREKNIKINATIDNTYRYVRLVIFPNALGIFPDNRFTSTELDKRNWLLVNFIEDIHRKSFSHKRYKAKSLHEIQFC